MIGGDHILWVGGWSLGLDGLLVYWFAGCTIMRIMKEGWVDSFDQGLCLIY